MEIESSELQKQIEVLAKANAELTANQQDYVSAKQSLNRMSMRLRKLCKRLIPTTEIVIEMQAIAEEIRELTKKSSVCLRNRN
jgi:hypothetical protein